MTITFYTVSKKRNSTLQPTGGTSYTGTLRGESGIVNPSVLMDFGNNTAPGYNYAYISEFSRYYWINEITSVGGGLWRVDMSVDVLATYKTSIGAANKYILRSASEYDGTITDLKYPTKAGYTMNTIQVASGWQGMGSGMYVVGVVTPGGDFGSVRMFALDNQDFETVRNALAPSSYYNGITDADLKNLAISVVNPMQYIAWVKYYPFTITQGTAATMQLGNIPVANMPTLSVPYKQFSYTFTLTNHPLAATRGTYLNCEPFTSRFLSWAPIGMINLPALTANIGTLQANVIIDLMSGTGDLRVQTPAGDIIYRTAFSCGVDVPVAQIVTGNPLKIVTGAISLVSSGISAMAGNIPGSVASGASAITDFISSQIGEVQAFKPGSGSLISDVYVNLLEVFADVVEDDNPEFGRPLCKVKAISTQSGYVLCADGDIFASGATPSEKAEIESYLTGGFFYD